MTSSQVARNDGHYSRGDCCTQPKGMYEEDGHLLVRRLAFTCELTTARFLPLLYLVVPLTVCGLAFPHVGANSAVRFPLLCGKP